MIINEEQKEKKIRGFKNNSPGAARELLSYSSGSYREAWLKILGSQLLNYFYTWCYIVIYASQSYKDMTLALISAD